MPLQATSIRLDASTLERIGQLSEAMERPKAWLMANAIKQYVDRESWYINAIEEGIVSANTGNLHSHDDVKAIWEAKRATAMD